MIKFFDLLHSIHNCSLFKFISDLLLFLCTISARKQKLEELTQQLKENIKTKLLTQFKNTSKKPEQEQPIEDFMKYVSACLDNTVETIFNEYPWEIWPESQLTTFIKEVEDNLPNLITKKKKDSKPMNKKLNIARESKQSQKTQKNDKAINKQSKGIKKTKLRRLPPDSVIILEEWFNQNINHPYPTDQQKQELANQSKLTFDQVFYWFINKRGRMVKKPFTSNLFKALIQNKYNKKIEHQ